MPLGKQSDQHPLDELVLAYDDPLDLVDGALQSVYLRCEPTIAVRRRTSGVGAMRTRVAGSTRRPRKTSGALRPTW